MIYSKKDIAELRNAAIYYKLSAPQEFWFKPAAELLSVCNGFGPAAWSKGKRSALTAAFKRYAVCAAIHDVRYEWHIGNKKTADKEFKQNMIAIWKKDFGWRRWLTRAGRMERAVISAAYAAVVIAGDKYWENTQ